MNRARRRSAATYVGWAIATILVVVGLAVVAVFVLLIVGLNQMGSNK